MELEQYFVVEVLEMYRFRLNDGNILGDHPEAFEAGQGFLHVVEHSEVENDVELAELVEVHLLEVGHHGLDLGVERFLGEIEAAASGQVGSPEIGLVARLVRQGAVADALLPVGATGHKVDAPGVVVQSHDAGGARLLGGEGELPVPGADVENAAAGDVGNDPGGGLLDADALRHHSVAQIDGVVPPERVGLCLELLGSRHGRTA